MNGETRKGKAQLLKERMGNKMNQWSIPLTSITYAIKAQNALRAQGIRSQVGRDERYRSGKSCGYALFLPPNVDRMRVMGILQRENIKLASLDAGPPPQSLYYR